MQTRSKKKVVVIGGGMGSFVILSGLRDYPLDLSVIVTVTDDGGSTGRLRDEFGFLPVGDMRQCIVALSEDEAWLKQLMLYRFGKGRGLRGHNLGNLILTALEDLTGSESKALEVVDEIFALRGKILPISLSSVKLGAEYKSGKMIISEHKIELNKLLNDRILRLFTIPKAKINPAAQRVILGADLIILGPGDLFNSTIANIIIQGTTAAIQRSKAKILYIVNLMTLKSQTHNFKASDHVAAIENYLDVRVDYILINHEKIPDEIIKQYKKLDEYPVEDDLGIDRRVLRGNFLAKKVYRKSVSDSLKRSLLRHDSKKLAKAIMNFLKN
ncbi:hypothetical protein AUJ38_03970 [bacterium CG1_02_42_9]|nr:MAG: hypothetical protein AUJ38_03970 [bacterium CG1_02_42_9]